MTNNIPLPKGSKGVQGNPLGQWIFFSVKTVLWVFMIHNSDLCILE